MNGKKCILEVNNLTGIDMKHFLLLFFIFLFVACSKTTESSTTESSHSSSSEISSEQPNDNKEIVDEGDDNSQKTDGAPQGYPFGLDLNNFQAEKVKEHGGGDCWGMLRTYISGDTKLVLDSSACGEYGANNRYYLFEGDELVKVHIKESGVDFDAKEGEGNYLATETIYSFKAVPPVSYTRTERLEDSYFNSLSTAYNVENIKDPAGTSERLNNELLAAEGPVVDHYICYKEDNSAASNLMIAFAENGRAIFAQYEGQEGTLELVYMTEDEMTGAAYPTTEGHYDEWNGEAVIGHYILTHSGNWDYAKYTREKDGKVFKFHH